MTQQNELRKKIVIALSYYETYIEKEILRKIGKYKKIFLYDLIKEEKFLELENEPICHYFDRFILVFTNNLENNRLLWKCFYELYADSYEHMINTNVNLMCIKYMLDLISKFINEKNIYILDFGCGSGLSTMINMQGKIIGYDTNNYMRILSESRGLKVLTEKEFWQLRQNTFSAVFSSYTMHMSINDMEIRKITEILVPNGVFVANFYKGIDYTRVNNVLLNMRMRIVYQEESGRFGRLYVFKKSE